MMEQMKNVLEHSVLWRMITALCLWCSGQWQNSAVIQWFLHPARWMKAASEQSIFFKLWSAVRNGLSRLYEKLRLEKLFAGSIFTYTWVWCIGAIALAALIPTLADAGLLLIIYCSTLLTLIRRREQKLAYSPMNKYVLLFMLAYLAAVFTSVTPRASLMPGMLFILFTGTALLVENVLLTRKQAETFTRALVIGAVLVALIGLGQYVFGVTGASSWVDEDMFGSVTRIYSTLQNPNVLAEYLVLILPLAGALLLTARGWGRRSFWFVCCGIITLALLLTMSRGGWLGALIAGALFVLLLKPKLILLAPVALALLWMVLPDSIIGRFSSIGNLGDSSTSYRVSIWMGTLAMLKDYWLCGVGPGTEAFNAVYHDYALQAAVAQHSHNLFLQLVSDGGILVLILFLLIIVAFGRQVCVAIHKNRDWRTGIFPIAALSGVAGWLAQGMTDHTFYNNRMTLIFWAVLGLGAVWARITEKEAEDA